MPSPKKVMIVDDDPEIVQLIELTLKADGYKAVGFTSPIEAVQEFKNKSQDYALIISDIRMPSVSGFDLARNIREINPKVALVFMTAFEITKPEFSSIFPSIQVSELIAKPFTNAELIKLVRKYVGITQQY